MTLQTVEGIGLGNGKSASFLLQAECTRAFPPLLMGSMNFPVPFLGVEHKSF